MESCQICGKKLNFLSKTHVYDGTVCNNCIKNIGIHVSTPNHDLITSSLTINEIKMLTKSHKKYNVLKHPLSTDNVKKVNQQIKNSHATKTSLSPYNLDKIVSHPKKNRNKKQTTKNKKRELRERQAFQWDTLEKQFKDDNAQVVYPVKADFKTKQLIIEKSFLNKPVTKKFSEIVNYQQLERPTIIKKHHGITRALVGGAFAGGVGAIVGATTGGKHYDAVSRLSVTINFSDNTHREITFITTPTKTDGISYSLSYKGFQKLCALLDHIIAVSKESPKVKEINKGTTDNVDEIRKFKKLADDGIITQAEFEAKKKQLLGL